MTADLISELKKYWICAQLTESGNSHTEDYKLNNGNTLQISYFDIMNIGRAKKNNANSENKIFYYIDVLYFREDETVAYHNMDMTNISYTKHDKSFKTISEVRSELYDILSNPD